MRAGQLIVVGASAVTLAATAIPHTVGLDTYRKIRAKYLLDRTEEPVKEKFQKMFQEVMDDLMLSQEERNYLRIFNIYGYDVFHAGAMNKQFGGVVGIPMNFEYENIDAIKKDTTFFGDRSIDWDQQVAKNFLNALMLSENAQKFGIAREILKIKENYSQNLILNFVLHIAIVYVFYEILYNVLKLSHKQKWLHYSLIFLVVVGGIMFGLFRKDEMNYQSDLEVDERLAQLGPKYIQAGKEFYTKLLDKNISLRKLLGENGKKLYTITGNDYFFMWPKTVSILERKSFFESKIQDIQQLV